MTAAPATTNDQLTDTYELITQLHATPCFNLSESTPQPVNSTFVLDIVQRLFGIYQFKNIVFYMSDELSSVCSYLAADFVAGFLLSYPLLPKVLIQATANLSESFKMAPFLSTPTLCVVLTTGRDDDVMELTARSLESARIFRTLFILFPLMPAVAYYDNFEQHLLFNATIEETYQWIWQKQFLKTALLTIEQQVYMLQPYPSAKVLNKTEDWQLEEFFADYTQDMQGYVINTPILRDMPRVFRTTRPRATGSTRLVSGVSALLFQQFLAHVNASLNDTTADLVGRKTIDNLITLMGKGQFETLIHTYTMMQKDVLGMSYPIGINDWCFMVPYRNRTPEYLHLKIVFENSIWLLYWLGMLGVSCAIWLLTPDAQRCLAGAWLQALCSSLFIAPLAVLRKAPRSTLRLLSCLLFIYGFCITTLYTTKLSSFLTSPPQQQQIDNERDVLNANLRLMLTEFEMVHVSKRVTKRFLQQLQLVDTETLNLHRYALNTSYGYSVPSDRWAFLNKQQRHMRYPLFRLSSICMGPYYHIFPLQRDSHLKKPLKRFIMMSQQNGLLQHWHELAFQDALWDGAVQIKLLNENPIPLSINFFRLIWYIWYLGLMLSGIVFILEIKGCTPSKCSQCMSNL